jgi:ComF family protein
MVLIFESSRSAGRLGRGLRRAGRAVLDFAFPPLCLSCRAATSEAHSLCAPCWGKIVFFDGPVCTICGFPFEYETGFGTLCGPCQARPPSFDKARAVMRYDDASKGPILALKRADRHDLVPAFARWLDRAGRDLLHEADIIVPVPLHRTRLWERRFNQAALVAQGLARLSGKPADPLVLTRARATRSQGDMPSAKARRRNVLGAFRVDSERRGVVRGRTVLLIDDVFTTGSTVEACARALKRAGASKVLVLTLARVVRPTSTHI